MSNLSTLTCLLLTLAAVIGGCDVQARADCYGELRESLSKGGYTGGLDCSAVSVKISKVGRMEVGRASFDIFDLQYVTVREQGLPPHGGQRLLIFSNGRYLGQYSPSTPPKLKFQIEGNSVLLNISESLGNRIELLESGPPNRVFLNEEIVTFYK